MAPDCTRLAPSHSTPTLERFTRTLTVGNMADMSRPARSEVRVRSALASAKRRVLFLLADEGPHHADAGDLLAQDAVDLVDAVLHDAEGGHHAGDDDPEHDRRRRHRHEQDRPRARGPGAAP